MTHPYHSTDSHTFREWDAKQAALRKRIEKLRRFAAPPVQEGPEPDPPEEIEIVVGNQPDYTNPKRAYVGGNRYGWKPHGIAMEHDRKRRGSRERRADFFYMGGEPDQLGALILAICDAYLERMEADDE